jgi:hypothetical protein
MTGRLWLLNKNMLVVVERLGGKRLGQNQRTDQSGGIQELQWSYRFDWSDDNVPWSVFPDMKEYQMEDHQCIPQKQGKVPRVRWYPPAKRKKRIVCRPCTQAG